MFGPDDVIASTLGNIANLFFKVEWDYRATKPGERTKADRLSLILLRGQKDPRLLKAYEDYLAFRDKYVTVPGYEIASKAMFYTIGRIGFVTNFAMVTMAKLIAASVDEEQTVRVGNPNIDGTTNPTHSQLAKDHDYHPFHTLAAELAKEAVARVGAAMALRWDGNQTADPVSVASGFIAHPYSSAWQDDIVRKWAIAHPANVKRGESATEWEALDKAHRKEILDKVNAASSVSKKVLDYLTRNYEEYLK